MKTLLTKLAQIAEHLENKGLRSSADRIDGVLESIAQNAPGENYDITAYYKIGVANDVYEKYMDPTEIPQEQYKIINVSVVVAPRENYNVGNAIEHKEFSSNSMGEAQAKANALMETMKTKYQPATAQEQLDFYPM